MKIRSLLLGSAAAAGLATGAYAADPTTLTALDACDSMGLSGIAVSSDTNCLQVSGEIKYEFSWGDYKGAQMLGTVAHPGGAGTAVNIADNDGAAGTNLDWDSKLEWWLKFVATADSDGGPVSAVIKIKEVQQWQVQNELPVAGKDNPYTPAVDPLPGTGADHTFGLIADEAYVTATIGGAAIKVGKAGSYINKGDDEPYGVWPLFNSDKVDKGVYWSTVGGTIGDGGHLIGVSADLGNGLTGSLSAENLQATNAMAGTLVGVLAYAGDGITAHVTGVAGGFLDGTIERFAMHAGFTGTFDMLTVRAALAADNSGYYNALASIQAAFDMFKLALAAEAVAGGDFGVAGSVSADVADGVTISVGGRYYNDAAGPDFYEVAAQVAAMVTETVKLTGEAGVYGNNAGVTTPFVAAEVAYAPGGDTSVSAKGEFYANGAIKGTVKGSKKFQ
jgi:hypothetical protein